MHVSWKQHTLEKSLDETVLKSEFWKQDGLHLFPFVPRTFDLRCSQLSRLIEEFVRLTFVTFVHFFSTVFSPYFSFASECFAYFGLLCKRCILWFQGFHLHEMKHINPKYFTGCFSSFCFAWFVIDFFPPLWSAQCVICDPWSLHTLYSLHTYLPYFVTSFLSGSLCDRLHSAERGKTQWDIGTTFVMSSPHWPADRVTTMHENFHICCSSAGGSRCILTRATISPNYRFWRRARSASPITMPIRAPDPASAPQHTRQKTQQQSHDHWDTSTGTQNNINNYNIFLSGHCRCKMQKVYNRTYSTYCASWMPNSAHCRSKISTR